MPTYEYECPGCLSRFDIRRGFDDTTPVSCPRCQCPAERLFSPVPVIFKGSGFYITDNRKDSQSDTEPTTAAKTSTAEVKAADTGATSPD